MTIWIDADACPVAIKETVFKASERTGVPTILVANQHMKTPKSEHISFILAKRELDAADDEISSRVVEGDLVVTSDLPLAKEIIDKGAHALSPRGELFSTETISAKVTMRDFMETMRASGVETGGPPPMHARDKEAFANQLNKLITRHLNRKT